MKFHFKLEIARGGYYFDEDNYLHPTTWFEDRKTEPLVVATEIHGKFIEILHPFHDLVKAQKTLKDYEGRIKYQKLFKLIDKKDKTYNAELETQTKTKILEFVNSWGLGGYYEPESINPNHTLDGFIDEPHGKAQRPNLYNLLDKAVEMNGLLLDRNSYETVPPRLKEICNIHSFRLRPRINGGLYMETDSIFTTMYWGMAFTEYTYEVKECEWCEAPLLADKRAIFCKPPRQCKNRFNNSKRTTKKGSK